MDTIKEEITKHYSQKLRVRVSGICEIDEKFVMIRHKGIGNKDSFWAPPGGGIHFAESAKEALVREFNEETGLTVEVTDFLCVNEFLQPPLHAIELFFRVRPLDTKFFLGKDPEFPDDRQIISDIQLLTFEEIKSFPSDEVHSLFNSCVTKNDLYLNKGFIDYFTQQNEMTID